TNAEVTGRTADIEVDANGRKVMRTGGQKTVYSWDSEDNRITSETQNAKITTNVLIDPLNDLNEEIQRLEKLLESKKFESKRGADYDILTEALHVFNIAQENELKGSLAELTQLRADLYAHLEAYPSSEIAKELSGMHSFVKDLVVDTQAQISREEKEKAYIALTLSVAEKYKKAHVLEVNRKIVALTDIHDQILEISKSNLEFRERLEMDRLGIERQIQIAREDQIELKKWRYPKVVKGSKKLLGKYAHQVIITEVDDLIILKNAESLAGKYPLNTTIINMDAYDNYQVVYGLALDAMPKGDIRVMINAHGTSKGVVGRSIEDVVRHIGIVGEAIGNGSEITKVSLIPCMLGPKYAKMLLPKLREYGIKRTAVSVRLGETTVLDGGRKVVRILDPSRPKEPFLEVYRSEKFKATYAYNGAGKIVPVDSYTDEHYDVSLSINEDGSPKIERIYGNKKIADLQGKLKVYVHAKGFDETNEMLHQFQEKLPSGASMAQLNIKTPKENDWFTQFDALEQGKDLKSLSETFDVDVLVYSNPGDSQATLAISDRGFDTIIVRDKVQFSEAPVLKNSVFLTEYTTPKYQFFEYNSDGFNSDFGMYIYMKSGQIPKIEETLKSLALTSKITTKYSISSMNIVMPKDERDITHYKELAKVLTNKYGIKSTVYYFNPISNKFDQCLSISPGDYEATIYNDLQHLGETQPYNDKKLQSWDTLTQEQTNKLTTESQKTKPDLANHDHQILIQTESDDNVKDSTLKLAFKHPTKTTIVQMDKDGAYRVVYGTQL
ncbi:C80 family cysteine peptidase, partial [Bathymodiolus thermophilus thioautotrophic gill symbiont]